MLSLQERYLCCLQPMPWVLDGYAYKSLAQGAGDDMRTWRDWWSLAQRLLDKSALLALEKANCAAGLICCVEHYAAP